MIRVLRFMSADEAIRLLRGQTIERDTDHAALGNHTTSVGACFAVVNKGTPKHAMYTVAQRLSGIAIMDCCLLGVIDPSKGGPWNRSTGRYRTSRNPDDMTMANMPEICSQGYSLADFQRWWLYTPELPPYGQMFKIIASPNWIEPVLTTSSIVKT